MVARNTIEEKVLALQEQKRDLFDQTIEQDRFSVQQLSRTDIEAFFRPEDGSEIAVEEEETISISTNGLLGTNELEETLLESRQRLTNAIVRDWMGWTSDEASSWLEHQVDVGILEKRGQSRGAYYIRRPDLV